MSPPFSPCPPPLTRRTLLAGSFALAAAGLQACGGGGGGDSSPSPAPPPAAPSPSAPTGTLAYRNGSQLELHSFDSDRALEVDPGTRPGIGNVGVGVSRSGLVTVLQQSDAGNDAWTIAVFDLQGNPVDAYTVQRELAIPTSAAVINADATCIAFSVNEVRSASDDTRVDRTLVAALPGGSIVAQIDGGLEPVWIDATGGLLVVEPGAERLHQYSNTWVAVGTIDGLGMVESHGAYDISPDGRYLAYASDNRMRVRNLDTGADWVAVTARSGSVLQACFSHDGRHLAVLADSFVFKVPFVLPFEPGTTVEVAENDAYELGAGITDCGGRIGWAE